VRACGDGQMEFCALPSIMCIRRCRPKEDTSVHARDMVACVSDGGGDRNQNLSARKGARSTDGGRPATISAISMPVTAPSDMPRCPCPKARNTPGRCEMAEITGFESGRDVRIPIQDSPEATLMRGKSRRARLKIASTLRGFGDARSPPNSTVPANLRPTSIGVMNNPPSPELMGRLSAKPGFGNVIE
jgi:hypothetical protein